MGPVETLRPVVTTAGEPEPAARAAIALLAASNDRTLADLEAAVEWARRR